MVDVLRRVIQVTIRRRLVMSTSGTVVDRFVMRFVVVGQSRHCCHDCADAEQSAQKFDSHGISTLLEFVIAGLHRQLTVQKGTCLP